MALSTSPSVDSTRDCSCGAPGEGEGEGEELGLGIGFRVRARARVLGRGLRGRVRLRLRRSFTRAQELARSLEARGTAVGAHLLPVPGGSEGGG